MRPCALSLPPRALLSLTQLTSCLFTSESQRGKQKSLETWSKLASPDEKVVATARSTVIGALMESSTKPLPPLALPQPNPFIPSEFTIKEAAGAQIATKTAAADTDRRQQKNHAGEKSNGGSGKNGSEQEAAGVGGDASSATLHRPHRLRESGEEGGDKIIVWHLQDRTFRQPRAEIYLKVRVNVLPFLGRRGTGSEGLCFETRGRLRKNAAQVVPVGDKPLKTKYRRTKASLCESSCGKKTFVDSPEEKFT